MYISFYSEPFHRHTKHVHAVVDVILVCQEEDVLEIKSGVRISVNVFVQSTCKNQLTDVKPNGKLEKILFSFNTLPDLIFQMINYLTICVLFFYFNYPRWNDEKVSSEIIFSLWAYSSSIITSNFLIHSVNANASQDVHHQDVLVYKCKISW